MRDPLLPIEAIHLMRPERWGAAVTAAVIVLLIVLATWPRIPG